MPRPVLIAFLFCALTARAEAPAPANPNTAESEDEAMITQVEQMGKSLQDALAKVMEKFKGMTGVDASALKGASPELNGLATKALGNVNKQVDELNKLSDEIQ